MYKALIADDEEIICKGIAKFLSEDPDIQVVAQAEDGETALKLATKHLPDLLFVDVNMPFLGGLEFIEKLSGILKNAVIIVVTGYDDFAYVQKALRLNVSDYLLKPIMKDVFYAAVERAKEKLANNTKQIKYLEWAKMQLERNKASLTTEFLDNWLNGHYSDTEVEERISYLGLSIPDQFGMIVAHLSLEEGLSGIGKEWDEDVLYYAAENIARELFEPFMPISSFKNICGDLVLISTNTPWDLWVQTGQSLQEQLQRHLPVQVTLVRQRGEDYKNLPSIYEQALEEMESLTKSPQIVQDIRKYIDQNYLNPEFSLQDTAEQYHISPQYLSRVFRQETGVTFVDYVTKVRIRRAIELLSSKDLKMYQIAENVGYSNQHYFSNAFKKVLGVSPMEYRKSRFGK